MLGRQPHKKGRRRRDMAEKEAPRSFLARLPPLDRSADIGNEEKQRCVVITHHADPVLTAPLLIQSVEESRVNWGEQWRWRSDALCGAKALHVLEHLRHPLISRRPLRHYPRLHLF
ncbi:uncharacterized protein [Zea mays]|uniref:uncharacterized protein isoform X8 n=1 Tax=Zea mays TaxID=4577 RepID=UPI001651EAE3|nr:uncharacterized protein LOC103629645 isoform X8 [Zea mays]